ncbi:MAG: cytochrome c family protein [Alphaproteobacteria bacterium]|nr:cytochrome c family protein [Alphaproteobacteria bacterium]
MRMRNRIVSSFAGYASLALAGALLVSAPAALAAEPVALDITDATGVKLSGDPERGAVVFKQCAACHSLKQGENKVGPSLFGVIGRKAGTVEGFNYSKVNKESGIDWTEQVMFEYLEKPAKTMPGTKMAFAGLKKPEDRTAVIAYIQQNGGAAQ